MLGNITSQLADKLLKSVYGGNTAKVPSVDYLGDVPSSSVPVPSGVSVSSQGTSTTYSIGTTPPDASSWLETLSGSKLSWLRALLTSRIIVQGSSFVDNPIRRICAPRAGQKVIVEKSADSAPKSLSFYGSARSHGVHDSGFKALEISYNQSSKQITVKAFEERGGVSVPLTLLFSYRPDMGSAPIHEVAEGRNTRIKEFYWKLWFGDNSSLPNIGLRDVLTGPEVTIDASHVERFCSVVGNDGEVFKTVRAEDVQAPMDFAIVTGWKV